MKVIHEFVNDDWERIYLDGEVIVEGHSIPTHFWLETLEHLGIETETREVEEET